MAIIQSLWSRVTALLYKGIGHFARVLFRRRLRDTASNLRIYTPLDANHQQIRVCSISIDPTTSDIELTLRIIRLHEQQETYRCLSYVWGGTDRSEPVTINGIPSGVTPNLWTILHRLLRFQMTEDIWIDAVCINQEDSSEMSNQVGLMGKIYANACEVLIGIETEGSCKPDPDICLAKAALDNLQDDQHLNAFRRPKASPGSEDQIISTSDAMESLCMHLQSAWYTRAWTVQEVCLAQHTSFLCICGRLPWITVAQAFAKWDNHRKDCCASVAESLEYNLRKWLYRTYSHIQSIESTIGALSRGQHILKALLYYQEMQATNPRDKVFAFRGLHTLKSGKPLPLPNYHESKEQTYTALTRWMLKDQRSLQALCVGLRDTTNRCPSWVADWSVSSLINANYRRMRIDFLNIYKAGSGLKMVIGFPRHREIRLVGIRADCIEAVSSDRLELDTVQNDRRVLESWHDFVLGYHSSVIESWSDAFVTLMLAGCIADCGKTRALQERDIGEWKKLVVCTRTDRSVYHNPVMGSHIAAVLHRKVFRTANGRVGIGPSSMRPGDEIWVLAGGAAPFVLRKDRLRLLSAVRHILIGHCYIDGLMQGEAKNLGDLQYCTLV